MTLEKIRDKIHTAYSLFILLLNLFEYRKLFGMLNEELLLFLSIFLFLFVVPVFFYRSDKGMILLGFSMQFLMVYVVFSLMPFLNIMPSLIWVLYAFSICCFWEFRRLRFARKGRLRAFVIPFIALLMGVSFFALCCLFSRDMTEWVLLRSFPAGRGAGCLLQGIVFFVFVLVVHSYYVMAYSEYKVRYFFLSMLPYLFIFTFAFVFFSGREGYYFLYTLFFWGLAMVGAALVKKYLLKKTGLIK